MRDDSIKNRFFLKAMLFPLALLCFAALFSTCGRAETISRIAGYFYTDDTFILNDKMVIVNVNSDNQTILNYDGTFLVMANNTCQRVINDRFCIEDIIYDTSVSKKKAQISVNYIGPTIEMTRSINKSEPLIGEGMMITVKIENKGNSTAKNVTYMDMFPPEIQLLKIKKGTAMIEKVPVIGNETGIKQNMTRVFWHGDMRAGEIISLEYSLRPIKYTDSSFIAKVIYNDGMKDIEVISSSMSIKTKTFFEIAKKFASTGFTVPVDSQTVIVGESKSELRIGEETIFITEIKNKALKNETINISYIDFYVPDGLLYKGPVLFKVYTNKSDADESSEAGMHTLKNMGNNIYRWQGLMSPDGLIFAIKLKGTKEGKKRLLVYAKLVQFKEKKDPAYAPLYEQDYSGYEEIEVTLKDPVIESNFNDGQTFDAGQKAYLSLYTYNPNEFANFTSIDIILESPWSTKNFTVRNLKKGEYINLFEGFVEMPSVAGVTTIKLKVNATYETEYGVEHYLKMERNINIKPRSPVKVGYSLSPVKGSSDYGSIIGNEKVIVTITLSNLGNSRIEHINFTQSSDPSLTKESNITRTLNLDGGKSSDVLKYEIDPPDVDPQKGYILSTYLDYVSGNETYHVVKDFKVDVNVKKMTMTATKESEVDYPIMGVPFYVDYTIENTNDEPIKNVTVLFPTSPGFDIIGSRYYTISAMSKDEKISLIGKERVRPKINGTSIKLARADIIFHDDSGNEFRANSSDVSLEVLYKPIDSPAIRIARNISGNSVNKSEKFIVSTYIENIGAKGIMLTLNDFGRSWDIDVDAGRNKTLAYEASEDRGGEIVLEPAMVNYTYNNEAYYASSNKNTLAVKGVVEQKRTEEKPAEKPAEVKEGVVAEKENPYLKYVYLALFVMIVCFIIFSVIRMKPKEKSFEFVKE